MRCCGNGTDCRAHCAFRWGALTVRLWRRCRRMNGFIPAAAVPCAGMNISRSVSSRTVFRWAEIRWWSFRWSSGCSPDDGWAMQRLLTGGTVYNDVLTGRCGMAPGWGCAGSPALGRCALMWLSRSIPPTIRSSGFSFISVWGRRSD